MHVSPYTSDTDKLFFLSLAIAGGALIAAPIAAYVWWKGRSRLGAAVVAFWWLGPWLVAAIVQPQSLRELIQEEDSAVWLSPAFGLILGFAFVVRAWRKWISKVRAEVRR